MFWLKTIVFLSNLAVHSGASWSKVITSYWADGNGCVFCSHDHSYGATSMYMLTLMYYIPVNVYTGV